MKNFKSIKPKRFTAFLNVRSLSIVAVVILIFNLLSTWILPQDVFLAYAANINTNELVQLANSERTTRGLSQLTVDSRLVSAAYAKGRDMLAKDYWDHYGPSGETPWQFIRSAGYNYVVAGENLAKDFTVTTSIHKAWMDSPSHRSNIINSVYKNVGIAAVTGEFQGSETTIVVQMFGALEESQHLEIPTAESVSGSSLPQTGNKSESVELSAPQILYPEDGEILNRAAFDIKGRSENGSKVIVYDFENEMGVTEVKDSTFDFSMTEALSDGDHVFSAINKDIYGNSSSLSNKVKVLVDTVPPKIIEESIKLSYIKKTSEVEYYGIDLKIGNDPITVKGVYNDSDIVFNFDNNTWQCEFVFDESNKEIMIVAVDQAGNKSEVSVDLQSLMAQEEEIEIVKQNSFGQWVRLNIMSKIFTRSIRGRVNFFIALGILAILIFERLLLEKTGYTKVSKGNWLHLPVFTVLIFVALIGSGGEIL